MEVLFLYALVLLIAVLVSSFAHRSVLSTAVIFLVAGFVFGQDVFGVISISAEDEVVSVFVELALFAVLFTDGMLIGLRDLRESWKLPGRALLLGMPLTFAITAIFAYLLLDLSWAEAFLIGAVLAPTDPVFASAIVGRKEVPQRLRRMLSVESGLNDGLALPVVIILIEVIKGEQIDGVELLFELLLGVAIGVVVPFVAIRLEQTHWFSASAVYEPLNSFAIGMLVFSLAKITHGNEFLAAFAAGITIATMSPKIRDSFHQFGESIAELLKLGALFLFGALYMLTFITDIGIGGDIFVVLVLIAARPIVLALVLIGSELDWKERIAAMWFGPKGFASVVYALLILESGIVDAGYLFHVIATVVVVSIIAHSSTDVVVARWFTQDDETVRSRNRRFQIRRGV